jgi:HK97 family phage major capsid protein
MSSEVVKRLRDRRLNVWEQAKAVLDRATDENRTLTADEQGQWDGHNAELTNLDIRIKSVLDTEQRSKEADDLMGRLERKPVESHQESRTQSSGEFRSWLQGKSFGNVPGSNSWVFKPPTYEQRTLSKLTSAAGGSTVPTSFYDRLMAHLIEVSGILQANPTIINTDSGETLTVPKTTGHSTALLTAEAGTLSASDPVFSSVALGAYKYGIIIQISKEMIGDEGVDVEGYLAMQAGRALGNAFGTDAINGNGTAKPTGLLNNTTLGVTGPTGVSGGLGATSATLNQGADLLMDLYYSVIAPYRASRSCAWLCRDLSMAAIRKVKSTTGEYIFQPSLVAGTPDTLIGKPIYIDPFMPAIATGAKWLAFGDLSQFFIRIAGGVRFERSDEFAFGTDLVSFRAVLRADSILVDQTGAVKHLAGATT